MTSRLLILVLLTAALFACGADSDDTAPIATTSVAGVAPEQVLESFLGTLRNGKYAATTDYVDESQLALFASIESGDPDTLVQMSTRGVTDGVRDNFWASFVEAIPGLAGAGPDAVLLSEGESFAADQSEFVKIDAEFPQSGGAGTWILRDGPSDGWMIDIIATFGAAFVNPLSGWMQAMTPEQRSEVAGLVAVHDDSWDALGSLQGDDEAGVAVRAALNDLRSMFP